MTNEAPGECLPYSLMKEREREGTVNVCTCRKEMEWEQDKVNVSFDCRINCAFLG